MSFQKLKRNIFISYMIVVIVFSFVIIFFYRYTRDSVREHAAESQNELTRQYASQVDQALSNMDNIALLIMREPGFLEKFSNVDEDKKQNYFDLQPSWKRQMLDNLQNFYITHEAAQRIIIYNDKLDYVSYGILNEKGEYILEFLREYDVQKEMEEIAGTAYSKRKISVVEEYLNQESYELISLKRNLTDVGAGKNYAVIDIQLKIEKLTEIFNGMDQKMTVFLYDEEGILLYASSDESMSGDENNQALVTSSLGENFKWNVVVCQPETNLLGAFQKMAQYIWTFIIVFAVANVVLLRTVMNKLVRPLQQLTDSVKQVNFSNMQMELENEVQLDEITQINKEFDHMFMRLNESIKNETDYKFKALQAQMNPHFLYNTLSVISAEAVEEHTDKIPELCNELAGMLRYTADFENKMVTLEEELDYCKDYLKLMAERYRGKIHYEICEEGNISDVKVPKVSIQPLLENCFIHGFREKEFPWEIRIFVRVDERKWKISVRDNGKGMAADREEEVNDSIGKVLENRKQSLKWKVGGLGLVSSIYRFKLLLNDKIEYRTLTDTDGFLVEIGGEFCD